MKRFSVASVILTLVIITAMFGCATVKKQWSIARQTDTISAYEDFLSRHPSSEFFAEAQSRLLQLYLEKARAEDNVEAYEAFLSRYPSSEFSAEAQSRLLQLYWEKARAEDNVEAYEAFLSRYPSSDFSSEAKLRLTQLYIQKDWDKALTEDNIKAYLDFLDRYPSSEFSAEARSRLELLRKFLTEWFWVQKENSIDAYNRYIQDNPQSPYIGKAKAIITDLQGRDIVDLIEEKKIEVAVKGFGIEKVAVKVYRLVPHAVTVRIPVGTLFVSRNPSTQNMVTTAESQSTLTTDDKWVSIFPDVACANRSRRIPRSEDSFTIQRPPAQTELTRLMVVINNTSPEFAVRQAAVWIVTDNADYNDLGILVGNFGSRNIEQGILGSNLGSRNIKEEEAAKAMRLCDDAGIDITRKTIWRDRQQILNGLEASDLKQWLEQK